MTNKIKAKEWWWDGRDFHYVDEKNQHIVLKDAYLSGIDVDYKNGDVFTVEPVSFAYSVKE